VVARLPVLILLFTLATLACARAVGALDQAEIACAIAKLGDPDAAVRDRATAGLWAAGKMAEPALQQASNSDDPEIARRARSLLNRIQLGLYPDTPQEVLDLIEQYPRGDAATRQAATTALANQGNRGLRALLGLRRFVHDPASRAAIIQAVGAPPHERAGAALMLAEGETAAALDVLKTAAAEGQTAAVRDWAALLLIHGGLDEQIARLRTEARTAADGDVATRLVYLARARGDFNLALQAADESDDPQLVDSILVEAGDWKRLAVRYRERIGSVSDTLGFTAAFCRLAGETDNFETATASLRSFADHHEEEYWNCAQCLMLNDRVDEGMAVLISHKNYLAAMDFLLPRLRLKEAMELPLTAGNELEKVDLLQLRARAIAACTYTGDRKSADHALREAAADNKTQKDLTTWLLLSDAARQLDQDDLADGFLASAMETTDSGDGQVVLARAALPNSFPALFWWKFLRVQHLTEPYIRTIKRLRALAKGELASADVDALVEEAEKAASDLRPFDQDCWLETIGQTLELLNRRDSAERIYRRLADRSPSYVTFQLVGDCQAARGDYSRAAITYQQAWEMDRTRAIPLILRGWALLKSGDLPQGRAAIELAHSLPLGDEVQRTALEAAFREHGLLDDARRERDLILRTGELRPNQNASSASHNTFLSWDVCNAYRLRGEEENARGDYLAAANSWERAFLGNLQGSSSCADAWGNVAIRAMIHKTRALGLLKQSPANALREASIAIADLPADANIVIDLVQAFEQAGRKKDADALYAPSASAYARLCEDFPDSELAHNLLAWTEAKCRRNLDDALKHGLRAVELQPRSASSIDTLAEVYFERGDIDAAIVQMNKCVELEPNVARHREQIERFKAARSADRK
jgi:tetratricopeptide (TPR) repeat protein